MSVQAKEGEWKQSPKDLKDKKKINKKKKRKHNEKELFKNLKELLQQKESDLESAKTVMGILKKGLNLKNFTELCEVIIPLVRQASEIISEEGKLLEKKTANARIFTDVHGAIDTFYNFIVKYGLECMNKGGIVVFLGDILQSKGEENDEMKKKNWIVLGMTAYMKVIYPKNIFLLRGDHDEVPNSDLQKQRLSLENSLFNKLSNPLGEFFKNLPIFCFLTNEYDEKLFLTHCIIPLGKGVFEGLTIDDFGPISISDLQKNEQYYKKYRGIDGELSLNRVGLTKDDVENWRKEHEVDCIVTGDFHITKNDGFIITINTSSLGKEISFLEVGENGHKISYLQMGKK